jgi:hypothetical protein
LADDTDGLPPLNPQARPIVADLLAAFPVDDVVDRALPEIRTHVPEFRGLDPEQTREEIAEAVGVAINALHPAGSPDVLDRAPLAELGARRAEQGVPLDALLTAFRLTTRLAVDRLLEVASDRGVDADAALTLTRAAWAYCDAAEGALVAGHNAHEDDRDGSRRSRRATLLRRLIYGEVDARDLDDACRSLGLRVEREYRVAVIAARAGEEPLETLARERLVAHYTEEQTGRVVGVGVDIGLEPWGAYVGYGDAVTPGALSRSLAGAEEAAELASTFHLERPQHADDVQLLRPVRDLPELGDQFVDRCFGHLDEARTASMIATLRAWFRTHGNTDAAANALYVHRNTLRYRIRTFSEWTGLNLDRPEDSFVVWWALQRLEARGEIEQLP